MIFRRILIIFFLVTLVLTAGIIGYMSIEHWNFIDSLYMSVITLSTVGYKEIQDLSVTGQLFTIALIAGGISVIAVAFGMFTSLILEGEVGIYLRRKQMEKKTKSLKNHIIICGLGELGEEVVKNLKESGEKFVVIDNAENEVERVRKSLGDFICLVNDAREASVLEEAGIKRARAIIICLGSDSHNLFVVITAREENPAITIVTEAIDTGVKEKLRRAGSDYIISPTQIGGTRMASVATKPAVVSFLDIVTSGGDKDLHIEGVPITEKSTVVSKTLREAEIPQKTGLIIISIKKKQTEQFIYNPSSQTTIEPGDELIVLGQPENIQKLKEYIT